MRQVLKEDLTTVASLATVWISIVRFPATPFLLPSLIFWPRLRGTFLTAKNNPVWPCILMNIGLGRLQRHCFIPSFSFQFIFVSVSVVYTIRYRILRILNLIKRKEKLTVVFDVNSSYQSDFWILSKEKEKVTVVFYVNSSYQ